MESARVVSEQVRAMDRPASNLSRIQRLRPILISIALVVPCFWQPIVSGFDLQSHLYNAWLATLIENGSIHGLWIGKQGTNVLIDMLLPGLLRALGVSGAEQVICCALVLILFWGAFRLISAVRGQSVYWLAPWLAVFSYGFVFQMGLLNYYLACGIVFWILAAFWERGIGWWAIAAIPLLYLSYLAHPMPVLWLVGIAGYSWIARRTRIRIQFALFLACVAVLLAIRIYLESRFMTSWTRDQLIFSTGIDQILLHGWKYLLPALGLVLFCAVLLYQSENRRSTLTGVLAQAYYLTAIAIIVIPSTIRSSTYAPSASLIADRLSLLSAVLLLALLSYSTFRRWYLYAGLAGAAIFFFAVHQDVGMQARAAASIVNLVGKLPEGARVVPLQSLQYHESSDVAAKGTGRLQRLADRAMTLCCARLSGYHLLSRACVGHCFDFANYEPSTGQFRIHASPGNPVVMATYFEVGSIAVGNYEIKPDYLPLYGLIRCGPDPGDLFMRPLVAGETRATVVCPETRNQH
jgi:hypothetical protein